MHIAMLATPMCAHVQEVRKEMSQGLSQRVLPAAIAELLLHFEEGGWFDFECIVGSQKQEIRGEIKGIIPDKAGCQHKIVVMKGSVELCDAKGTWSYNDSVVYMNEIFLPGAEGFLESNGSKSTLTISWNTSKIVLHAPKLIH